MMGGMVSSEEKTQALLCWILGLFIGIISPLIFYFISKDKPFTYVHAAQCLGVHLAALVLYVISGILCFVGIGFFLIPLVGVYVLVISILGAVAANNGQPYNPPVTADLARNMFKV
jgi:uncharacterized protein